MSVTTSLVIDIMDLSAMEQSMGNVFVENVNVKEIGLGQLVDA